MSDFVVAVDGPAGSGKSSVCREAAKRLGFGYLDTGAGYRAFALHAEHLDLEKALASFDYQISTEPENFWVKLSERDVTEEIRSQQVAARVSQYAKEQQVRDLQRHDAVSRIRACPMPGVIVEGRDITTVVAPDANVRVLLTASEEVRLKRRSGDSTETASNQLARDRSDSRVAEFLEPAPGVTLVDTSELDFEQSVAALIGEIEKARR